MSRTARRRMARTPSAAGIDEHRDQGEGIVGAERLQLVHPPQGVVHLTQLRESALLPTIRSR